MLKYGLKIKIYVVFIISLFFLGTYGAYENLEKLSIAELKEEKPNTLESRYAHSISGTMSEQTARGERENTINYALQSTGIITEDSEEFLEGTIENLFLNDEGYLSLSSVDNWGSKADRPSARYGPAMAYISKSDKLVLFGGSAGGDETWIYDPPTNIWTKMNPESKPSARRRHSMAYNAQLDKIVLFGGSSGGDETWVYDLSTNTWTNMNPSPKPSPRQDHTIIYDSISDKIILFGGNAGGSNYLQDTWTYDLGTNTWTNKNPSAKPSARKDFGMAFDSSAEKVILFGGYDGAYQGDTWTYDLPTNTWTNKNPTSKPSVRWGQALAYNSHSNKTILYGGFYGVRLSDTWAYDFPTNAWTNMNPPTNPGARDWYAMTYDNTSQKIFLFGGRGGGDDIWGYTYPTNSWARLNPSTPPSSRYGFSMAYNNQLNKIILFGGTDGGTETWSYTPENNTWKQLFPSTNPSARYYHSMVYESSTMKFILFGGKNDSTSLGDTWSYDDSTNTWTNMSPSLSPSYRHGHSMVYDKYSNKVVLFGGDNGSSSFNDTWSYDLQTNTWNELYPSNAPSPRYFHQMVYHSYFGKVVLFGGSDGGDETWVYDLSTNTWTNMNPWYSPSNRYGHSMIYDEITGKIMLFGGFESGDETWSFQLQSNTWTHVYPLVSPSSRYHHSMVYDSQSHQIVLFGGINGGTEIWGYPQGDSNINKMGVLKSNLYPLGNIYNISGEFVWNPLIQPVDTLLKIQIGLSNTTHVEDIQYTDFLTSGFSFKGLAQYLCYQVTFESDVTQTSSPLLTNININYSLEKPQPIVQIVNPQNDSTVEAEINISVLADSPNGIEKVCFYVDGLLISIDDSAPYNCLWNSINSDNDIISVIVVAVSKLGRESVVSIQVLVDNPVDPVLTAPTIPSSLTATAGVNIVTLSWNVPSDDGGSTITHYNVYRGVESCEYVFLGLAIHTNFTDTTVTGEKTYYYVVTAVNTIGESIFSIEVNAIPSTISKILPTVPSPPRVLSASTGESFIILNWNIPSDDGGSAITYYKIYRGITSGNYRYLGISISTTFNDTLLLGGTTYYYVVTAINGIGESKFSSEINATPTGISVPKSGSLPSLPLLLVFFGIFVVVTRKFKKT